MAVTLTLSLDIKAHHWIAFVSCGFVGKDIYSFDTKLTTALAPNYGRVFVKIKHIEFIREYRPATYSSGPICSSIHMSSGGYVLVIGSVDNIAKRIDEKNNNNQQQ